MCLILFAWDKHPSYKLVLAANRDEFYARPTARAHWWEDQPAVLAGRDLKGKGTWMGVNRNGSFAALTNYREVPGFDPDAPSRGPLVSDFLANNPDSRQYLTSLSTHANAFNGFNLLVGNPANLWYFSNRTEGVHRLESGIYGLSNALLDSPWPKVESGKTALAAAVEGADNELIERLFFFLTDQEIAQDKDLPATGVPLEWERKLSSRFIKMEDYGTRVSTVLLLSRSGQIYFEERAYEPKGPAIVESFSHSPQKVN